MLYLTQDLRTKMEQQNLRRPFSSINDNEHLCAHEAVANACTSFSESSGYASDSDQGSTNDLESSPQLSSVQGSKSEPSNDSDSAKLWHPSAVPSHQRQREQWLTLLVNRVLHLEQAIVELRQDIAATIFRSSTHPKQQPRTCI